MTEKRRRTRKLAGDSANTRSWGYHSKNSSIRTRLLVGSAASAEL